MVIDAFIPARAGSKRVPGKNLKELSGHPLIAYSIVSALESNIFRDVYVSTDGKKTAEVAEKYGAKVIFRPSELSGDRSLDVEWLSHALHFIPKMPQYFAILRPTNPFRQPETIKRAWNCIKNDQYADSLRAIRQVKEHPGKMWTLEGKYISPLMNYPPVNGHYSYNSPTQALPPVYVQSAALEMGLVRNVEICRSVSGMKIIPFFINEYEDFDINTPLDMIMAKLLVKTGVIKLPQVKT